MKVYLVGCTHFRHERIIELCQRPFSSIKEHDTHIMDQINKLVQKEDRLYLLGDLGLFKNGEEIKAFRKQINCQDVRCVRGNHDLLTLTAYQKVFQEAGDLLEYRWGQSAEELMVLSHYGMIMWNKSFAGSYHCYSHSHAKAEPWMDHAMPHRRSLDCGIDNAKRLLGEYRPFSLDEILSLLKDRKGNSPDRLSCRVTKYNLFNNHNGEVRYAIETDFNWSFNEAIDNCRRFYLYKEPKEIIYPLGYYESNGNFGFINIDSIPIGTILFWAHDF